LLADDEWRVDQIGGGGDHFGIGWSLMAEKPVHQFPGLQIGHLFNAEVFAKRLGRREVVQPARICDLRSTFASNALAAGMSRFELERMMGTSTRMLKKHHGTLLDGATAGMAKRLAAFEAEQERVQESAQGTDS
jgi:hypothetical protein